MKMHKDLLLESIFCKKKSIFCHDKTNMTKQTSNHSILLLITNVLILDITEKRVINVRYMLILFVIITLNNQSFFDHSVLFILNSKKSFKVRIHSRGKMGKRPFPHYINFGY